MDKCPRIFVKYASCGLDNKSPTFTNCPKKNIEVSTSYRTNVAKQVTWEIPTYTDNSMNVENYQLTLTEKNGYTSPRDFEIGEHHIEYTVTDRVGNKNTCKFKIIVKGTQNFFLAVEA